MQAALRKKQCIREQEVILTFGILPWSSTANGARLTIRKCGSSRECYMANSAYPARGGLVLLLHQSVLTSYVSLVELSTELIPHGGQA